MTRYLFTMWDGGGNVPPELAIARRLIARGHSVRVLGDPTLETEAREAGCEFSSWTTAPHRTSREREHDVFRDYEYKNPLAMLEGYMDTLVGAPTPRWLADISAVLDRHPVDAVVADFGIPSALIAAEARGLGSAVLVPNVWIYPTPGIPPLGPGWMPARGPLGRLRDWVMRALVARLFRRAEPHLDAARQSQGLGPGGSTHEQMLHADRVLVLTSPVFDFTSPSQPPQVRYTGPELGDPLWCAPWSPPWPESDQRPLVAVGLSSTFQDQVATMRRIVEALSGLDVRGLVTLGEAIHAHEVPGTKDVVVVGSAPHAELFRQATAIVTHCGHGTTMKALAAGKPLVCMPMGRDQNDTAARVVHAGAGVRIKPAADVATIRAAVRAVLDEPRYRTGAERLATAIAEREGCHDAVAMLEGLAPGAAAPSSPAARVEATAAASC